MEHKQDLLTMLTKLVGQQASDLHLVVGQPPVYRQDGQLKRMESAALTQADMEALLLPHLPDVQNATLTGNDVNASLYCEGFVFRLHVYREHGHLAAVIRIMTQGPPQLDKLRLTDNVMQTLRELVGQPRGLLIITGMSGSGKITTCGALLDEINRTRAARILTLEDPIEYEIVSQQGLVTQRSVGEDVRSFENGLRSAWHEDPDILYISELRTLEAVQLTLAIAEAGHLVIAVMSVESATEAIQRLIEVFSEQRDAIRRILARTLIGVVAQQLMPRKGGGRISAQEILLNTPRVKQAIHEGQTDFTLAIEAGRGQGMQTMDDALLALYQAEQITYETAWQRIQDKERLGPYPLTSAPSKI